jgi:hypothetical protein
VCDEGPHTVSGGILPDKLDFQFGFVLVHETMTCFSFHFYHSESFMTHVETTYTINTLIISGEFPPQPRIGGSDQQCDRSFFHNSLAYDAQQLTTNYKR